MHIVVAIFLLLATTGLHVYTLETQSSPPECMDPNSQPELLVSSSLYHVLIKPSQLTEATFQVNTECASSLVSPSSCLHSRSYNTNDDCVAYCEQYLYWFSDLMCPSQIQIAGLMSSARLLVRTRWLLQTATHSMLFFLQKTQGRFLR